MHPDTWSAPAAPTAPVASNFPNSLRRPDGGGLLCAASRAPVSVQRVLLRCFSPLRGMYSADCGQYGVETSDQSVDMPSALGYGQRPRRAHARLCLGARRGARAGSSRPAELLHRTGRALGFSANGLHQLSVLIGRRRTDRISGTTSRLERGRPCEPARSTTEPPGCNQDARMQSRQRKEARICEN